MSKNAQKEAINLSAINKNNKIEANPKINESNKIKINEIANQKEEKYEGKDNNLPKLCLKKESTTTNNNNNINNKNLLNQKRERNQSHNKEIEEEISKNNTVNNSKKKMPSLNEAKKEMKDFEILILNTEKEIQKKYGFTFPDLSYEDNLPDEIKNKLIDNFLESPKIKKILNEINSQAQK